MKLKANLVIKFALMGCLAISGCGQDILLYSGPKQPPDKVASIVVNQESQNLIAARYSLKLDIDGQCVTPGVTSPKGDFISIFPTDEQCIKWHAEGPLPIYVQMLPGPHKIKWEIRGGSNWDYQGEGVLDAKAGRQYRICYIYLAGRKTPTGSYTSTMSGSYGSIVLESEVEVKDHATWLKEGYNPKDVVIGARPKWADWHTCEICGKNKAAPCEYGCFKCRSLK